MAVLDIVEIKWNLQLFSPLEKRPQLPAATQRFAIRMIFYGEDFIQNNALKTLVSAPLQFTNRTGNILKSHQGGAFNSSREFLDDTEHRLVVGPSHRGRELRFDQIRPPTGELRQDEMFFDAQSLVIVFHAGFHVPKTTKHSPGPRRAKGTRSRDFQGVAREIHVGVQTGFVETKLWFARTQRSPHTVKGISRHQMSIAVDDHRHPLEIESLCATRPLSAYKIPAIGMQAQGQCFSRKKKRGGPKPASERKREEKRGRNEFV